MSESSAGYVVKSVSIDGLLMQRDAMLASVRQAIEKLRGASETASAAGIVRQYRGFDWLLQGDNRRHAPDFLSDHMLDDVRKRVDSAAWNHLMHESGLRTFMDKKAREEWDDKIAKCDTPALTRENIAVTFESLYAARGDMFDRGVIRCFQELSWSYKTNNPARLGKRIVKYVGNPQYSSARTDALVDLQRVFCVLDGKIEEDHRSGLFMRLAAAARVTSELDDTYMALKWFKNGNAHITFKRPELVEQLNAIIARHYPDALPAGRPA